MTMKKQTTRAIIIGITCILPYLANYYLRQLLGVLTPEMLELGVLTTELAGLLSSAYMLAYAIGQLFNGVMGDVFCPKNMVFFGLMGAGAAAILFPHVSHPTLQVVCFIILGYALSMLRGPLVKIISENTAPQHAQVICVFLSVASFAGPLCASLLAMLFNWVWAFTVGGGIALGLAIGVYLCLSVMERRGLIAFKSVKGQGFQAIFGVFKVEKFGFYLIIAALVEIAGFSISFWLPTYFTNALGFDKDTANLIFSTVSILRSLMPFATLAIFRLFKERDVLLNRWAMGIAAAFFLLMLPGWNRWVTLGILLIALLCLSISGALLWSIYIPSLAATGRVSSANGVIDCTGYAVAALANFVFAQVLANISWNGVILLWSGMALIGVVASFFVKKKER